MRHVLSVVFLIFVLPSVAEADSDGYFCVGKDYIAYQFGLAAPSIAPHRLTIVRFGAGGFHAPQIVDLPQLQVYGMHCGDSAVRVAAFDAIYTIALDSAPRVIGKSVVPPAERRYPTDSLVQRNLTTLTGAQGTMKAERVLLGKSTAGHLFELVITPTPSPKPCAVQIETTLVESDEAGKQIASRPVFAGEGHRECGEAAAAGLTNVAADKHFSDATSSRW